jgi:hypothetical protein
MPEQIKTSRKQEPCSKIASFRGRKQRPQRIMRPVKVTIDLVSWRPNSQR